ncbi:MAG: hypothetical protein MJZ29_09255 [Bacteroidaceae bacterium]|nr:hypothetical protein [Bacteroidaceae bacterium]
MNFSEDIVYYLYMLALIIVGFFIVKKVASCLIRIVVTVAILAICAYIYYTYYLTQGV